MKALIAAAATSRSAAASVGVVGSAMPHPSPRRVRDEAAGRRPLPSPAEVTGRTDRCPVNRRCIAGGDRSPVEHLRAAPRLHYGRPPNPRASAMKIANPLALALALAAGCADVVDDNLDT